MRRAYLSIHFRDVLEIERSRLLKALQRLIEE